MWLASFFLRQQETADHLSLRAQGFQALLSGVLSSGDTGPDTQMITSTGSFYRDPVLRQLHASDDSLAGPINYCNLD